MERFPRNHIIFKRITKLFLRKKNSNDIVIISLLYFTSIILNYKSRINANTGAIKDYCGYWSSYEMYKLGKQQKKLQKNIIIYTANVLISLYYSLLLPFLIASNSIKYGKYDNEWHDIFTNFYFLTEYFVGKHLVASCARQDPSLFYYGCYGFSRVQTFNTSLQDGL